MAILVEQPVFGAVDYPHELATRIFEEKLLNNKRIEMAMQIQRASEVFLISQIIKEIPEDTNLNSLKQPEVLETLSETIYKRLHDYFNPTPFKTVTNSTKLETLQLKRFL